MLRLTCLSLFLAISLNIEFFACGLTSVNRDLVILGIEDFSISVNIILLKFSFIFSF
jgi:hypothetical protein